MKDDIDRLFNEGVSHSLDAHQHRECRRMEQAAGSDRRAVVAFDRVLDLDARHTGALSGKAMSLATLGQTQDAVALFHEAIEIEPGFAENHRQLGLCMLELGDIASARQATFLALEMETQAEYRRAAAVEIYNIGGGIMMNAAQHRNAGRRDDEVQCYMRAKDVFTLALDVDRALQPATEAIRIVSSYMGAVDDEHGVSDDSRERKESSGARGFWDRLFGKK